jgi:hypothetical protein
MPSSISTRILRTRVRLDGSVRALLVAGLIFAVGISSGGCATRTVRKNVVKRSDIEIDFVRQVKGIGRAEPRGFEQPAIISVERMEHILGAIEVETPHKGGGMIRQPAFHPDILHSSSEEIVAAFAEVGPDEELGVNIVRKEMRFGVLHRKFLTSFLAHIEDGYLYLDLTRVDWKIPKNKEDKRLPVPIRGQAPMDFRIVAGDHLYYAGPQTLEIDWRNPVFQTAYKLPGTTSGEKVRREILYQTDVPKEELDAASPDGVRIDQLSAEQLRALADLEEDRREGRLTEAAYQKAKRQLLRKR